MNYWEIKMQQKLADECRQDRREIAKAQAKAEIRVNAQIQKVRIREAEEERRRGVYEELVIAPEGDVQVVTRNLSFDSKPREVINAKNFSLTILQRLSDLTERIYLIDCYAGTNKKRVFLSFERAGDGNYLVKKFGAAGICFKAPTARAKEWAVRLVGILLRCCSSKLDLPDKAGWVKRRTGDFYFHEEGCLTWEKAKKLCQ